MREALALFVSFFVLLQAIPVALANPSVHDEGPAATEPVVVKSQYSASGAKLNDLWLANPRATGIPVPYDDVLLIINDASQISKDIGAYFLANRPIPAANVCPSTRFANKNINHTLTMCVRTWTRWKPNG